MQTSTGHRPAGWRASGNSNEGPPGRAHCIREYTNDDWTFRFFLSRPGSGATFEARAEIHRRGVLMCHLVSNLHTSDREAVLASLMQTCRDWVRAWRWRLQNAETVPGELR